MRLETQPDGLWTNSNWTPETPGTFAVVVGVSQYDYISGGSAPARNTYNLEQLYVSATTAYKFFEWLRTEYDYPRAVLAKCWILLSPTAAERKAQPALTAYPARPTLDAIARALNAWRATMEAQGSAAADSRGFFFFSGHGLEQSADHQVLLPCDYLAPQTSLNHAIRTDNIYRSLLSLATPAHLLFVDACRDDNHRLSEHDIEGTPTMDTTRRLRRGQRRTVVPILHSTSSGAQAWQPQDPNKGLSLFGQALLEGLTANGLEPDCSTLPCAIKFLELQSFVNDRVADLLHTYDPEAAYVQPVTSGGAVGQVIVTHVHQPPGSASGTRYPTGYAENLAQEKLTETFGSPGHPVVLPDREGPRAIQLSHRVFGGLEVATLWSTARAYSLERHEWLHDRGFEISLVTRSRNGKSARASIVIPDDGAHWLGMSGTFPEQTIGVVLPGDRYVAPRYRVGLLVAPGFVRVEADLDPVNQETVSLDGAARLWARYRAADPTLLESSELDEVTTRLTERLDSPLAGVIAALILLRTGRLDLIGGWLKNLASVFPEYPDGAVLWAEALMRRAEREGRADNESEALTLEATQWLYEAQRRGVPYTSETLGYAVLRTSYALDEGVYLSSESREKLKEYREQLRRARRVFRPLGLCTVFVGHATVVQPSLLGLQQGAALAPA